MITKSRPFSIFIVSSCSSSAETHLKWLDFSCR